MSKQPSNTAGIETMISESLIEEKEGRKLNLTVGGLLDSTSHVPEDRQIDDEAKRMKVFQMCKCRTRIGDEVWEGEP